MWRCDVDCLVILSFSLSFYKSEENKVQQAALQFKSTLRDNWPVERPQHWPHTPVSLSWTVRVKSAPSTFELGTQLKAYFWFCSSPVRSCSAAVVKLWWVMGSGKQHFHGETSKPWHTVMLISHHITSRNCIKHGRFWRAMWSSVWWLKAITSSAAATPG